MSSALTNSLLLLNEIRGQLKKSKADVTNDFESERKYMQDVPTYRVSINKGFFNAKFCLDSHFGPRNHIYNRHNSRRRAIENTIKSKSRTAL